MSPPHSHTHVLTPYPHESEGTAFPFPSVTSTHSFPSSSSPHHNRSTSISSFTSNSSSYPTSSTLNTFKYPTTTPRPKARPHAPSHPSVSFGLSLSNIGGPIPPSLLQRRRSSCSTVSSCSSGSSGSSSNWGNWNVTSPLPGLSRSGSGASLNSLRSGKTGLLKTPENPVWGDFEYDSNSGSKGKRSDRFFSSFPISISTSTSTQRIRPIEEEENRTFVPLSNEVPDFHHSSFPTGPGGPGPIMFAPLAKIGTVRPKITRRPTPLVPLTMERMGSRLDKGVEDLLAGLFRDKSRSSSRTDDLLRSVVVPTTTTTTTATTTATTTTRTTTTTTRPKLTRKLTPHPEYSDEKLNLDHPLSKARDLGLASITLDEEDEVETEVEASGSQYLAFDRSTSRIDEEEDEEEEVLHSDLEEDNYSYSRTVERKPVMRRFSSLVNEGQIWLAV